MIIKVMRDGKPVGMYPCDHVEIQHDPKGEGVTFEMSPTGSVSLPVDGDTVFIMEAGRTVDTIRWPS